MLHNDKEIIHNESWKKIIEYWSIENNRNDTEGFAFVADCYRSIGFRFRTIVSKRKNFFCQNREMVAVIRDGGQLNHGNNDVSSRYEKECT
mmetsp:Transcript_9119/g.19746  ORF Transcript_9119/g.19746 Transcript_9119/m.19746 type:complete len:91 (-) Transcript_9119:1980-2252(-)